MLAEWIEEALGLSGSIRMSLSSTGETVRMTENAFDLGFSGVCEPCNNGWMSVMEGNMKRLMLPALLNQGQVVLSRGDQGRVAAWAVKTALLLERALAYARGPNFTPDDNFDWLYKHRSAPPTSVVWIGRMDTRIDAGTQRMARAVAGSLEVEPGRPIAYLATFTVGYLLVQVLGREVFHPYYRKITLNGLPVEPRGLIAEGLVQIWPRVSPRVTWPPARSFAGDTFARAAHWPLQVVGLSPGNPSPFE